MKLTSPAFADGGPIPSCHACDGDDVAPELRIGGVPEGTVTLALIVDDPDAPAGTWTHWTVWNVPPDTGRLAGTLPGGAVEGTTSWGDAGWRGPCPPSGMHRYVFVLYALDTALELPVSADAAAVRNAMAGHILDEAVLSGTYARR